jgi:hypothetical protein
VGSIQFTQVLPIKVASGHSKAQFQNFHYC